MSKPITDSDFCNLHIHTVHSLLDGYLKIEDYMHKIASFGQKSTSITDHGTLAGTYEAYAAATKAGVKFFPGIEAYVVPDRLVKDKKNKHPNMHMTMVARSAEGWKNLMKLNFDAAKNGAVHVYDRLTPRTDFSMMEKFGKGIVATSGCMAGPIASLLLDERIEEEARYRKAAERCRMFQSYFDNFYLEIQPDHLTGKDQTQVNHMVRRLSQELKIPCVVTSDSHYLEPTHREDHHMLLAIQCKKSINDPTRLVFEATPPSRAQDYLKWGFTPAEIAMTAEIADQCEQADYLKTKGFLIPKFPIPDDKQFLQFCKDHNFSKGLVKIFGDEGREAKILIESDHDLAHIHKQEHAHEHEHIFPWTYSFHDKWDSIQEAYYSYLLEKGWNKKIVPILKNNPKMETLYRERVLREYDVIKNMGFVDYFLIVGDMIQWAKSKGIYVGNGRGSAGGCLIAYLLEIHKIDPIKYDLLFERFLNPSRVSMPDIDTDIETDRREEVKQYLVQKYGEANVANISTLGRMKLRACVQDVVRSCAAIKIYDGKTGTLVDDKSANFRIATAITSTLDGDVADVGINDAFGKDPKTGQLFYPDFVKSINDYKAAYGIDLEHYLRNFTDLPKQHGVHAAGVIISPTPLAETMPMTVDKDENVTTEYDMTIVEKMGYLKLDILGLKTLSIIKTALNNIRNTRGEEVKFVLEGIPLEPISTFRDRIKEASPLRQQAIKAFSLLRAGDTAGVFQLESDGMQNLLKQCKVNSIDDISAVLALHRPGPLGTGMTATYAKRKVGDEPVSYPHPSLEGPLKETYGVLTYQEQVMKIAVEVSSIPLDEVDTLRKAVGKKDKPLMAKYEGPFIDGCVEKSGMTRKTAEDLWEDIKGFAEYGFNKSHSICYSLTAYQTAYLKANYPAEFWAATLTYEANQDKVNEYIREARKNGIQVLPVDINISTAGYESKDTNTIVRSLKALKGVGDAAVEDILTKRKTKMFENMQDFLGRIDSRKVNMKPLTALIQAGAFDNAFTENYTRFEYVTHVVANIKKIKDRMKKYGKLDEMEVLSWRDGPLVVDYEKSDIFAMETEIYGEPVSGHPFDDYSTIEETLKKNASDKGSYYTLDQQLDNFAPGQLLHMMVECKGVSMKFPYKAGGGKFVYRVQICDRWSTANMTMFDKEFNQNKLYLEKPGRILILECKADKYNDRWSLKFNKIIKVVKN